MANNYLQSLVINNSSFEDPILEDGDFTVEPPPGWNVYDPNGLTTANPDNNFVGAYNTSTTLFPGEAAEGENAGFVFIDSVPGTGVVGLTQTLDTVVTPNTRYTVVADVGNATGNSDGFDYSGFPGYAIGLYAENTLLDYTINPVTIPEGEFRTVAFSYATLPTDAFGENLEVRLLNLNSGSGFDVEFDRIQVFTQPAGQTSAIAIANAGFDEVVLQDNSFDNAPPPGWHAYDPNGLLSDANANSGVGTFNPPKSNYFIETTGETFSPQTEGNNTGYVFLTQEPGSGIAGLAQTLDATLTANTLYTLLVDVGNPAGFDTADTGLSLAGFPGYRVELLAGDTVIARDNNTLQIAEGNFGISTVNFIARADNPLLGENLQIRLISLLNGEGLEVDFDFTALYTEKVTNSSSVFIDNPSFEFPALADNGFSSSLPSGWELYDPNGLLSNSDTQSGVGVFNPPSSNYFNEATDGHNVGYVFLTEHPGSGEVGLSQTLDTVLAANTRYTLTVDVGNPTGTDTADTGLDFTGFPGYRVELLAGDTVLATEQNNLFIPEGTFESSQVTFTTTNDSLYLGQNLGIRLVNLLQGSGVEVDFDNVRLNAEVLPSYDNHFIA